jgi:hypothetical protein
VAQESEKEEANMLIAVTEGVWDTVEALFIMGGKHEE